jgi:hypothetical protein
MRFSIHNTISTLTHHLLHPNLKDDVFTFTQTTHITNTITNLLHQLSQYTNILDFVFHIHRVYTDSINTLFLWFAIISDDGIYILTFPTTKQHLLSFDYNYLATLHQLTFIRSSHLFYRTSLPYYPPYSTLHTDVHSAYTNAHAMTHAIQHDILSRIHLPEELVYYWNPRTYPRLISRLYYRLFHIFIPFHSPHMGIPTATKCIHYDIQTCLSRYTNYVIQSQ